MSNGFAERDIAFLLEAADPRLLEKIDIIKGDGAFIDSVLENQAAEIVRRMMVSQETVLSLVTPKFLFEALLRAARKELAVRTYTLERSSLQRIPVFDTEDVLRFISDDAVIKYLAEMLTSFTHIRSFTWPVRVRKGIWRRIRFNDMDLDSLIRYCETVEDGQKFELFKRMGDLCLFIVGIFPEYTAEDRDHSSRRPQGLVFGRRRRSAEDYEREGRRFYRLAAEHNRAALLGSSAILRRLGDNFDMAKKPLNYISERFLDFRKGSIFPSTAHA